ncbi:N5-glutamine methyltransferase family protein [Jiella pelagia]|uniref:Peptide chain release factor N(5)-glutamine methyltransferase n=1 Tax=Jiella pelagia TaxID=2986949 RepID=A0ABY7C4A6_9HYPH|nr:HemK/PrmC family methyltransferase [Jiella pelagia]WAP70538.1 peptide chain release factor N(5)-glutamine methyltransferase [Jiella pelagia]
MGGTDENGDQAEQRPPPDGGGEGAGARLGDVYRRAAQYLRNAATAGSLGVEGEAPEIVTPDLDARLLVAEAAGLSATEVHRASGQVLTPAATERLDGFVARRILGEPVHRIIGRRAFYEHEFALSAETLEPRPETETLVEVARPFVEAAIAASGRCVLADIGTGSGAIAVSLLALYDRAFAVAIDVSSGALVTARRNAEAAGVADRFFPVACDHLSALGGAVDLVVSNPPIFRPATLPGCPRRCGSTIPLSPSTAGRTVSMPTVRSRKARHGCFRRAPSWSSRSESARRPRWRRFSRRTALQPVAGQRTLRASSAFCPCGRHRRDRKLSRSPSSCTGIRHSGEIRLVAWGLHLYCLGHTEESRGTSQTAEPGDARDDLKVVR